MIKLNKTEKNSKYVQEKKIKIAIKLLIIIIEKPFLWMTGFLLLLLKFNM